ncbi:hypothetical protein O3P69_014529 [Scylla paramamosain]|uniref:Ionotropic glutamate receptor C-terminal domain-containing protein n=1 Tax=Scylla paramamosain TaxID=85552 RepID=A0AAW0TBZ4_SCYPA
MMGQLQREESDFCTESAPTPGRLRVIEYARGYPADEMSLTSLKPSLLPQHTALVRPFLGEVWVGVALGVVVWSVTVWILQRMLNFITGGQEVSFVKVMFYGWGALLEQPPDDPSKTISGQMLVGWWLVFCLVISTGFRSALIAHLTVQSTTKPIETLEDLVKLDDWKWGTEEKLYKGAVIEYFTRNSDPVVKKILANLEVSITAMLSAVCLS